MSEQGQEQLEQKAQQDHKKKRRGGILVAIVIIVLLAIIVYLLWPREKEQRNVLVTPDNVERVLKEAQEKEEMDGYYTVTMNPTWHFGTGDVASYDGIVENVQENTNDIYFDVVLEEDESKVLYSSPIIPRGGRLDQIKLDEVLDAGTYNCIVIYHLVDEEQNTLSMVRVTVKIVVEG